MKRWTMLWVVLGCACGQSTNETPAPSPETPPAEEPSSQAAATPELVLDVPEEAPSEPVAPPADEDKEPAKRKVAPGAPTPKAASATKPKTHTTTPTRTKTSTKPSTETTKTAEPSTEKEPEPEKRTRIPRTQHVRVSVTPAFQKLLDSDSRMQPWVNKVMQVAQRCYRQELAKNPKAGGAIKVQVTMHESARPTPDIKNLPPSLSGMVACATGALFQTRMPLFTGPEGARHNVSLHFTP